MDEIQSYRKLCLKQQTELRRVMIGSQDHDQAIQLFMQQHAMLHSAKMAQSSAWSYEDALLDDMSETHIRRIPRNCEHSVAWRLWHIARIEDVAMNLLVAGSPQILNQENWFERMKTRFRHTGNAMDDDDMAELSATLDIPALRAYRQAVGRRTRQIVSQLRPQQLKYSVDPGRLQRVMDEGVLLEAAAGIAEYWGKRNIAGLLLMPATRHNLVHLNEALEL